MLDNEFYFNLKITDKKAKEVLQFVSGWLRAGCGNAPVIISIKYKVDNLELPFLYVCSF
jgi:hypothetical protein